MRRARVMSALSSTRAMASLAALPTAVAAVWSLNTRSEGQLAVDRGIDPLAQSLQICGGRRWRALSRVQWSFGS